MNLCYSTSQRELLYPREAGQLLGLRDASISPRGRGLLLPGTPASVLGLILSLASAFTDMPRLG